MSVGLVPMIISMILCIFFSDATVLYIGSLASILYWGYQHIRPSIYHPNLMLLHGTLSLTLVALMKYFWGDWIVPDQTVPIILEILILCCSSMYLLVPGLYQRFFSMFRHKISVLNDWAIQIVVYLSAFHLAIACIVYLFFRPLSHPVLYFITHIVPPLLYTVCLLINYFFVKAVSLCYQKTPFLRIAPICNGKIYVTPRKSQGEEPGKWDIPMEDYIYTCQTDSDRYAKEIEMRYSHCITGQSEPRFSLKHLIKLTEGTSKIILLYVLPLSSESEIHFANGKFVTPEEIAIHSNNYSAFLNEEIDHLSMVVEMWKEFQS